MLSSPTVTEQSEILVPTTTAIKKKKHQVERRTGPSSTSSPHGAAGSKLSGMQSFRSSCPSKAKGATHSPSFHDFSGKITEETALQRLKEDAGIEDDLQLTGFLQKDPPHAQQRSATVFHVVQASGAPSSGSPGQASSSLAWINHIRLTGISFSIERTDALIQRAVGLTQSADMAGGGAPVPDSAPPLPPQQECRREVTGTPPGAHR